MKLKELTDRDENFDEEEHTLLQTEFYTEAKSEEIQNALKYVGAAAMRSGLKFRKVVQDETKEILVMDAQDAEATVIQSLTKNFVEDEDYDYQLGSHETDPDTLFIVADLPEEEMENEEGEAQEDGEE